MTSFRFRIAGSVAAGAAAGALALAGASAPAGAAASIHGTVTCGTKSATRYAAPGVGKTATYQAATSGSVTVLQSATATLTVQSVTPAAGWTDTVRTSSGAKVDVIFRSKSPLAQERFTARVNSTGSKITVILVSCT